MLVKMTFALVHASYNLAEWQAVKLFFLCFFFPGEGLINGKSASQHVLPSCSRSTVRNLDS